MKGIVWLILLTLPAAIIISCGHSGELRSHQPYKSEVTLSSTEEETRSDFYWRGRAYQDPRAIAQAEATIRKAKGEEAIQRARADSILAAADEVRAETEIMIGSSNDTGTSAGTFTLWGLPRHPKLYLGRFQNTSGEATGKFTIPGDGAYVLQPGKMTPIIELPAGSFEYTVDWYVNGKYQRTDIVPVFIDKKRGDRIVGGEHLDFFFYRWWRYR